MEYLAYGLHFTVYAVECVCQYTLYDMLYMADATLYK